MAVGEVAGSRRRGGLRGRAARRLSAAVSALLVPLLLAAAGGPAAAAPTPVALITASGSSLAASPINEWIANLAQQGLQVVFTANGSAAGLQDYQQATVDFAVSDVSYKTGYVPHRPYVYLPILATATTFPYHLVVAGHRITNLRLSGWVLAKIFTDHITNWDDPAITADNNGHALPHLPITTVVPSVASGPAGTTATFTGYLADEFPHLWRSFNHGHGGMTDFWPRQGRRQVAEDGPVQIMNYIKSSTATGASGLAAYPYPLAAGFPVANVENAAGYYVLPTEYNVAVALTHAQINTDKKSPGYLLQNLDKVYRSADPRAYPLSSYIYTIMPVSASDPRMTPPPGQFPAKWQTLADFLYYSICWGQMYIGPLGYSALPLNLVQAGFQQIDKIKKAAPAVNISKLNTSTCHNPTFKPGPHPSENYLYKIAPYPPLCDKTGHGPCSTKYGQPGA